MCLISDQFQGLLWALIAATPRLKVSREGAAATAAGKLFHCLIVLGKKLCWISEGLSFRWKNKKNWNDCTVSRLQNDKINFYHSLIYNTLGHAQIILTLLKENNKREEKDVYPSTLT